MIEPVSFAVLGKPAPQGSKTPIKDKQRRVVGMRESSPDLAPWRSAVSAKAREVRDEIGVTLDGPLMIRAQFRFAMPTSRPLWAKQQGQLLHIGTPDLDKLMRGLGDGLKDGGLIRDDARFAVERLSKIEVWDGWTGVMVRVSVLDQRAFAGAIGAGT